MKQFKIKYRHANGTAKDWHREVANFIAAIDNDPELKGRIAYRCIREKDSPHYFDMATAADDQAIKALQQKEWFKQYTARTREVAAGGEVQVTPLEIIAEKK